MTPFFGMPGNQWAGNASPTWPSFEELSKFTKEEECINIKKMEWSYSDAYGLESLRLTLSNGAESPIYGSGHLKQEVYIARQISFIEVCQKADSGKIISIKFMN